jgi:hypothetical protein
MAPNENLTAVLYGIEDLRLENYEVPAIKDNGNAYYLIFSNFYYCIFLKIHRSLIGNGLCWNLWQ